VLDAMLARGVRVPAIPTGPSNDDPMVMRGRMVDALAHRLGAPGELPPEAVPFRGNGLHAMLRQLLAARGESRVLSMSVDDLLTRAIATSDLPDLLQATVHRVLLPAYNAALSPVFSLSRESTAVDFRAKMSIHLGEQALLDRVAEGAEITYGGIAETSESYALLTYGKLFQLTREAEVNDDLSAFADVSAQQGRAAAQTANNLLVSLLTSNSGLGPTLADGNTLFHANHGNLAGSGAAISATTLTAGKLAMRRQVGLDGKTFLNTVPVALLVPPEKETLAVQSIAALYPPTSSDVNPFTGQLTVAVDPRLSGNRYYLFASKSEFPVLEFSYLASAPGPQVATRPGWDRMGTSFRVYLDFGAGVLDFRGVYSNPGA
jgi:hypothetical protein